MSMDLYISNPHETRSYESEGQTITYAPTIDTGINMSNRNACLVANALGLNMTNYSWQGTAGNLLELCQRWLSSPASIIFDEGFPTTTQGKNFIDVGLPAGYLKGRIEQIRDASLKAIGLGGLSCEMSLA